MGKGIASGHCHNEITICKTCLHKDPCGDKDYITDNSCYNWYGWISVDDRLPNNSSMVIVLCKHAGIWLGYYNNFPEHMCWMHGLGECLPDVTHWMPLPQPPKED